MKKLLSLFAVVAVLVSLCACGGGNNSATDSETENPTNNEVVTEEPIAEETIVEEPITIEVVAGTYKSRMWFLDTSIVLNENTTYDLGGEKGTFNIYSKTMKLIPKDDEFNTDLFAIRDGYIYDIDTTWNFYKDEEYGLAFSPDENGFSDQTFEASLMGAEIRGTEYDWISLDLNADGTYALKIGNKIFDYVNVSESYEGTYTSDDSVLTLNNDGQEYPLVISGDRIVFLVYDKVE